MLTNVKPPRVEYAYGEGFKIKLAPTLCAYCGAMLRPSAVRCVDAGFEVICEACHRDVLTVTTLDSSDETDRAG
jgi:hypothetical protein